MKRDIPVKRFLFTTGQCVLFLHLVITGFNNAGVIQADINTHAIETQEDVTVYLGNVDLKVGDTLFFEIRLPTTEYDSYMENATQRGILNISLGGLIVKEVPWDVLQDSEDSTSDLIQVFYEADTPGTYAINITKLQGVPFDFVMYKNLPLDRVDDFAYQTTLNFLLMLMTFLLGMVAAVHLAIDRSKTSAWAAQLLMPFLMVIVWPIAYLMGTISPSYTAMVAGREVIPCSAPYLALFWIWEATLLCYVAIAMVLTIRERRMQRG